MRSHILMHALACRLPSATVRASQTGCMQWSARCWGPRIMSNRQPHSSASCCWASCCAGLLPAGTPHLPGSQTSERRLDIATPEVMQQPHLLPANAAKLTAAAVHRYVFTSNHRCAGVFKAIIQFRSCLFPCSRARKTRSVLTPSRGCCAGLLLRRTDGRTRERGHPEGGLCRL